VPEPWATNAAGRAGPPTKKAGHEDRLGSFRPSGRLPAQPDQGLKYVEGKVFSPDDLAEVVERGTSVPHFLDGDIVSVEQLVSPFIGHIGSSSLFCSGPFLKPTG
jgi:hypothetical protein